MSMFEILLKYFIIFCNNLIKQIIQRQMSLHSQEIKQAVRHSERLHCLFNSQNSGTDATTKDKTKPQKILLGLFWHHPEEVMIEQISSLSAYDVGCLTSFHTRVIFKQQKSIPTDHTLETTPFKGMRGCSSHLCHRLHLSGNLD